MTALDILVLVLVGGAGILGGVRGFVAEALSLIAWILAILAVKLFHAPVSVALTGPIGTESGAAALALVLLFGVTFLLGKLLARALGKRTRQSVLGPVDRVLGFGFGALKGLIGATLIFLVADFGYTIVYGGRAERPDWMTQSRTYPLLRASGTAIADIVEQRGESGEEAQAK